MINLRESFPDQGLKSFEAVYHNCNPQAQIVLDHERTLSLIHLLLAHVYTLNPKISLVLDLKILNAGLIQLHVYDHQESNKKRASQTDSFLSPDSTLSIPNAQPALVLAMRLIEFLQGTLSLGNKEGLNQNTRFLLTLPQLPQYLAYSSQSIRVNPTLVDHMPI